MSIDPLSLISEFIHIVVLLLILVQSFRYARRSENKLYLIFYMLGTATFLLSELYWIAQGLLRDGARVAFGANDIADFGTFLLLTSALNAALGGDRRPQPAVTAGTVLFAVGNAALWIAWSGEWLRDIIGGFSCGYYIVACGCALWRTGALRRPEQIALTAAAALLIAAEAVNFFLPMPFFAVVDAAGYVILFATDLFFLVRSLAALRGPSADRALSLCFAGYCWNCVTMYMCADTLYSVATGLLSVFQLLTFLSVRKKVRAA